MFSGGGPSFEDGNATIQSVVAELHVCSQGHRQGIRSLLHAPHVRLEQIVQVPKIVARSLGDDVEVPPQLVEAQVDAVETPINVVETLINGLETLVDPRLESIETVRQSINALPESRHFL